MLVKKNSHSPCTTAPTASSRWIPSQDHTGFLMILLRSLLLLSLAYNLHITEQCHFFHLILLLIEIKFGARPWVNCYGKRMYARVLC